MSKFYKRWQFWLYLVVIIANVFEIIGRDPFNILNWHSWVSLLLIIMFSYYAYTEIKENS